MSRQGAVVPFPPFVPPRTAGKPLPHSEESERAVLAVGLLQSRVVDEMRQLTPADFYVERHQLLYRAMLDLDEGNTPIDLRTLQARLEEAGLFERVGGIAFLAGLDLDLPDIGRVATYVDIVRRRATTRELIRTCATAAQEAMDGGDIDIVATRRALEDLEGGGLGNTPDTLDMVAEILDDAETWRQLRQERGTPVFGIPSGLSKLDTILGGFGRGLYLLGGPTSVGKTSLAFQMAIHAARTSSVVYCTFENSAKALLLKALAGCAEMSSREVRRGDPGLELGKLTEAAMALQDDLSRLVLINGDPSLTTGQVVAAGRQAMDKHKTDRVLVVIDYLQLMAKSSKALREVSDARGKIDALLGELIVMARRLDGPVLALASQSREGHGKTRLESLKESGDLEYGADAVLFLTRPDDDDAPPPAARGGDPRKLSVKKNREGPTGEVDLRFFPDRGLFRELDDHRD